MRKAIIAMAIMIFASSMLISEENGKSPDFKGGIFLGYRFQEDLNLYDIGVGFDAPINNSEIQFSGLFEVNIMFGKNNENNIFGVNALPGLRMKLKKSGWDLYLKFDLLSGLAMYDQKNLTDKVYGNFSEVRFGIGYKMFEIDFGTSAFIGNGLTLAKPMSSIMLRFHF